MGTEIDEISMMLGELKSQNAVIVDGIKDIRIHLADLNGKTAAAHRRLDGTVSKKDALKAVLTLGAVGGVGGTGLFKAIAVLLGMGGS